MFMIIDYLENDFKCGILHVLFTDIACPLGARAIHIFYQKEWPSIPSYVFEKFAKADFK